MLVEICANSFESARNAQLAGAHRIELCVELGMGGITPSHGLIEKVCNELSIPVCVLIRPRSGHFCYSEEELDIMIRDVKFCRSIGCAGIVTGVLAEDFTIAMDSTARLRDAAGEMEFVFHRAFDWVRNPIDALQKLNELKIDRILTSGGNSSAYDGLDRLQTYLKNSGEITIMPGGGISLNNILAFKEVGFTEIHFSAGRKRQMLRSVPFPMRSDVEVDEGIVMVSDLEVIRSMLLKLS